MKKMISLLLTFCVAALTLAVLCIPAGALVCRDLTNQQIVLESREWTGGDPEPESCYFIEKNTTISKPVTLPASSMLVISDGAQVKLTSTFTAEGAFVVHSGSKLNIRKGGSLVLKKDSVGLINGYLAISRGGKLRNYGLLHTAGKAAVKGVLKCYNGSEYVYAKKPEVSGGGKIIGGMRKLAEGEYPLYHVEELSAAFDTPLLLTDTTHGTGCGVASDSEKCRQLIHQLEAVLYKAMTNDDFYEIYGADHPSARADLELVYNVQTIPEDGSEPMVFGSNSLEYQGVVDPDGPSDYCGIYEAYFGTFRRWLFDEMISENPVEGWNSALTGMMTATMKNSRYVTLAECVEKDGEDYTFSVAEEILGGTPMSFYDDIPEGEFLLSGCGKFTVGETYILALGSDCTELTLNGVRISVGESGNVEKISYMRFECAPTEDVDTLGEIKALIMQ